MPKRKSISADAQWFRTVALAKRWAKGVDKLLKGHPKKDEAVCGPQLKAWCDYYEQIRRHVEQEDAWKQFRCYTNNMCQFEDVSWRLKDPWELGRIVGPADGFRINDIVLIVPDNGTDRWPVWAYSGKGLSIRGYYLLTDRCASPAARVQILELPTSLAGLPLDDARVVEFVRKGSAADWLNYRSAVI